MAKGSRQIRAGQAFVELMLNDTAFERGLKKAQARLNRFGDAVGKLGMKMMAIGAAGATGFLAASKHFASSGDEIAKIARRTGLAAEAVSELGYAADRSGASIADVERAMRTMARVTYDAESGLAEANRTFDSLGMTAQQVAAMSPDEQFTAVARALGSIEDPARKSALAMRMFGRGGTALIPMFENLADLRRRARDIFVVTEEEAKNAEILTDAFYDMTRATKGVVFVVGAALAEAFTKAANRITEVVSKVIWFIRINKDLVMVAFKSTLAIMAAGASLLGLAVAIKLAAFTIGALLKVVLVLKLALAAIGAVLFFVLSPIGLATVAISGLMGAILKYSGRAEESIHFLGEKFRELFAIAKDVFRGVRDALMSGDINLAAKVLWAGLKMAWLEGTKEIQIVWNQAWRSIQEFAVSAFSLIQKAWAKTTNAMAGVLIVLAGDMKIAWAGLEAFYKRSIERLAGLFASLGLRMKAALDPDFDLDAALKYAADQVERRIKAIGEDRATAVQSANEQMMGAIAASNAQLQDELAEISKDAESAIGKIGTAADDRIKAIGERLTQQRAELDQLIKDAESQKITTEFKRQFEGRDRMLDDSIMAGIGAAARGLFNVQALQGLQTESGRPLTAIEKNTADTAKLLERIQRMAGPILIG